MVVIYGLATAVLGLASVLDYGITGNTSTATLFAVQSCMVSLWALGEKFK
jgi:hypothetical protein